jgi:hypothetical protein
VYTGEGVIAGAAGACVTAIVIQAVSSKDETTGRALDVVDGEKTLAELGDSGELAKLVFGAASGAASYTLDSSPGNREEITITVVRHVNGP